MSKYSKKIPLSTPHMSEEGFEQAYIKEAFETNWIAPLGRNVDMFEKEFAQKVDAPYAVALNSGTAAMHMALKAAGVQEGDTVFCQDLTFVASANPILYQGAIPVFIDSEEETWNMDPEQLEKAFQSYPHAKVVIIVHLYGIPAKMDEIKRVCDRYNAIMIEDAAESLGSYYKGEHTGTIGDYGVFSFNGNKIITTSGGGMLVSPHKESIEKVRYWSTQAREPVRHYEHEEIGYNYRLSNVLAGIGRGQLKVLDRRVQQKKAIFNYYKKCLKDIEGISFMPYPDNTQMNCWLTCLILPEHISVKKVINYLEINNIEARPIWKPMHMQPLYRDASFIGQGVSEELYQKGICLPSDTKVDRSSLHQVASMFMKVVEAQ